MDQMSDTYYVGIVFESLRSLPRPLGKSLCFKSQQQMDYANSGTGQIQKIGQLKLGKSLSEWSESQFFGNGFPAEYEAKFQNLHRLPLLIP
jgi:hypothetical protein